MRIAPDIAPFNHFISFAIVQTRVIPTSILGSHREIATFS